MILPQFLSSPDLTSHRQTRSHHNDSVDFPSLARHGLLRPWLERLVVAEAVQNEVIEASKIASMEEQFCKRHSLESEDAVNASLAQQGLTRDDLHWQLALPLRIQEHCQRQFGPKAEQHFLSRKTQLDQVVYSLLRVRDGGLARELYLRIQAGEASFADLAARYAEGPEQTSHGIVGPVPLTQAHPLLAEKLRTVAAGTLLEPFSIEQWWLVVRPERLIAASFDEAMANQMSRELFDQWVADEVTLKLRLLAAPEAVIPAL